MENISSHNLHWTIHVKNKMKFYGLSESRVKRALRSPKRIEEGVAENTIALMQPTSVKRRAGKESWNQEIWVMIQRVNQKPKTKNQNSRKMKIISAWRYPGVAPKRNPIPLNVIRDLEAEGLI